MFVCGWRWRRRNQHPDAVGLVVPLPFVIGMTPLSHALTHAEAAAYVERIEEPARTTRTSRATCRTPPTPATRTAECAYQISPLPRHAEMITLKSCLIGRWPPRRRSPGKRMRQTRTSTTCSSCSSLAILQWERQASSSDMQVWKYEERSQILESPMFSPLSADDSFTSAFVSTVGIDFKVKTVFRQDKRVKLQIWVRQKILVDSVRIRPKKRDHP